jgi:N-formylglutamate deformylase
MSVPFHVTRGDGPIVLGMPHVGTQVPAEIASRLNDEGKVLRDTDWHIEDLYRDLIPGLTVVQATFHRYVIDANRDPSGQSLYPGASTTELVPTTTFDGTPIWQQGQEPTADDIAHRLATRHAPYHAALAAEMERVRAKHGVAILYDCHSIRSIIPWLFEGTLPDFNTGTNNGATCDAAIEAAVADEAAQSGHSNILNGRFKGGWTTRHYGRPAEGFHAIQMELAQSSHLATETPPFALDPSKTASLRPILARMLTRLTDLAPTLAQKR